MTELKVPEWALKEDGSPGNTIAPKLGMEQEYLAKLASERYDKILQLERELAEEKNHSGAALSRISTREQQLAAKDAEIEALKAEVERLKSANELDRRALWGVVNAIDGEISGRMWLIEGRGPYEWDDDRYRQEFGWAVHALQEKLEPLRKIANDLTNCPETEKGVDSVRKLEKENTSLRKQVERLSAPVSDEEETEFDIYPRRDEFNLLIAARLSGPVVPCPSCNGTGTEADYVGLEMRCVEVECSDCKGNGTARLEGK